MKIFKKAVLTLLVASMSATMLTGCNFKKKPSEKEKPSTQKVEYITELNKDNVEEVVIEYKEILSYYNDLKNNLKIVNDVSKDPDLERDSIAAKDSIHTGGEMLTNTKTLYAPLKDAKDILLKMYALSEKMAENVVKDPTSYQEELNSYEDLFKEFKQMMDDIRSDVEAIRGKSPVEENTDEENEKKPEETKPEDNKTEEKDENSDISSSEDPVKPSDNTKPEDTKPDVKPDVKPDNTKPSKPSVDDNEDSSSSSATDTTDGNTEGSGEAFVPSVSSLSSGLKNDIKNAGYSSGANYKQSGGDSSQIDRVATQMFNDLEGDNPIQGSQVAEARAIFVNAFKSAYNSN